MFIIQSLRWCLPLTCLCLLVSICVGSPTADGLHHSSPNEKRADNFFAITGPPGTVHPRLEISQLRKNNAQWNLYLLALNRLYARGQTTRTSYYQLAGIHGRPFVEWDGVGFAFGRSGGYCPHGSTLFPTWHRPYLALYEQVLYGLVQEVANSIGGAEYQAAAKTFRIPYWDWAAPAPNGKNVLIGPIGGSAYIQISLPTGPKVIDNPLYRYHFHPLNPSDLPDDPVSNVTFKRRMLKQGC